MSTTHIETHVSDVLHDDTGYTCACCICPKDETGAVKTRTLVCAGHFSGYTVTTVLQVTTGAAPEVVAAVDSIAQDAAELGQPAPEPVEPVQTVLLIDTIVDPSVGYAAYMAHVGTGRDLCPDVARAEAVEHDKVVSAALAVQAALEAAEQERQDVLRARQVQEALLALLAPKTGASA